MITTHTQLLNYLISRYGLRSYLELGVQNPANNFDKISKRIRLRIGVDPSLKNDASKVCYAEDDPSANLTVGDISYRFIDGTSSDDFFSKKLIDGQYHVRTDRSIDASFDIIFIDGLHHADQVKRDFENSLKCLNDGGFIVLHDTLPENEEGTLVPRQTKMWWGDVYKWCMELMTYDGIRYVTFNMDNGCTVVWKHTDYVGVGRDYFHREYPQVKEHPWPAYKTIGDVLMNVRPATEVEKWLPAKEAVV